MVTKPAHLVSLVIAVNRSGLSHPITCAVTVSFSATRIRLHRYAFPVLTPPSGQCLHRRPKCGALAVIFCSGRRESGGRFTHR